MKPLIPITDSHCHLPQDADAAEALILRLKSAGIDELFIGGYDPDDWQAQIELKRTHAANVHMSFGLHPWFVHNATEKECEAAYERLERMTFPEGISPGMPVPAGIGETGLDHALARTPSEREHQAIWFKRQLELAAARAIPPVLHIVRAWGGAIKIMSGYAGPPGMVHAFSGDKSIIKQLSRMGFLMSVCPAGLASKNRPYLANIPDHLLAIESDAPTGALPAPKRGRDQLDPTVIFQVAEELARLRGKGETGRELLELSSRNLRAQFKKILSHP
ncbi:MAG: hypothetical protein RIQ81_1893 [Pseudomonadota bacterium]